jgi:hypothetical protein
MDSQNLKDVTMGNQQETNKIKHINNKQQQTTTNNNKQQQTTIYLIIKPQLKLRSLNIHPEINLVIYPSFTLNWKSK